MTKIQIISCEICDMTFTRVSSLNRHKKSKNHINSEILSHIYKDNYKKQDIHLNHIKNLTLQINTFTHIKNIKKLKTHNIGPCYIYMYKIINP